MSGQPPFHILATLDTGPITNHVTLVENANGKFAYVTVGGENAVKVYRRGEKPELVSTITTGDLPHGIWGSGDGTRVYVGLDNQDAVIAIDTLANKILATIPIGQQPQALVYVPEAVPIYQASTCNRFCEFIRSARLVADGSFRFESGTNVSSLARDWSNPAIWREARTRRVQNKSGGRASRADRWTVPPSSDL